MLFGVLGKKRKINKKKRKGDKGDKVGNYKVRTYFIEPLTVSTKYRLKNNFEFYYFKLCNFELCFF